MKCLAVLLLPLLGCDSGFEFDFDLGTGPVVGQRGAVTFAMVDGCPGEDFLFGCRDTLPPFAMQSHPRFILGSITGDIDDERRVARAWARSLDPRVATVTRDADGLLLMHSHGPGAATIEIVEDGEVMDLIEVKVESMKSLEISPLESNKMLAGAPFPVNVRAIGPSRTPLYGRGAIVANPGAGLTIDPDITTYFSASDQFALRSDTPGEVRVDIWSDTARTGTTYEIVTREQITEVDIEPIFPTDNKATLAAVAKINGAAVHGGPTCDWRIVSSGSDVTISPYVGNAFAVSWFTLDTAAVVYGAGEVVVECRVNKRLAAQETIVFAPAQ
jgi:hypothetical protein